MDHQEGPEIGVFRTQIGSILDPIQDLILGRQVRISGVLAPVWSLEGFALVAIKETLSGTSLRTQNGSILDPIPDPIQDLILGHQVRISGVLGPGWSLEGFTMVTIPEPGSGPPGGPKGPGLGGTIWYPSGVYIFWK